MNYSVLTFPGSPGVATITAWPDGGPDDYLWGEGISLAARLPPGAAVAFSHNFPDDRKLADFMPNTLSGIIASAKVRTILDGLEVENVEFLPLAIKDHKGRVVDDNYFIVNPLGAEEGIDMVQSKYRFSALTKDQIDRIKNLVIARDKIRPNAQLFRCTTMRKTFMIRDDVKAAFEQQGVTGYKLYGDGWNGLEIF